MVCMTDIYFKVDSRIDAQDFWEGDIEKKKELIDLELKKYALSKIEEVSGYSMHSKVDESFRVEDLLNVLSGIIPMEQHFATLRHFTHYILLLAGGLQGHSIVWWGDDNQELIETPLIQFDKDGRWDSLTTHEDTDYVKTFSFVYDTFQTRFMIKENEKMLTMSMPFCYDTFDV